MEKLTQDQLDAIQNDWSLDGESDEHVDWHYEEIDEHHVKHDVTQYEFIFQDPSTLKWYRGYYSRSYNYGIDEYSFPIELDEVDAVEVKTIEWRKVRL